VAQVVEEPPVHLGSRPDIFFAVVDHNLPNAMAYRTHGVWHQISARQVYQRVTDVAQYLRAQGFQKGDRVAIISENRPEWGIADFACQLLGLVDVPIYPTLTAEQ